MHRHIKGNGIMVGTELHITDKYSYATCHYYFYSKIRANLYIRIAMYIDFQHLSFLEIPQKENIYASLILISRQTNSTVD